MSGFFWNVHSFNKSNKLSVVKRWVNEKSFQFGCLLERRVKESKAPCIVNSVFQHWSFLSNYEFNRLGRIWMVWRETVKLTPVFKSGQMITCEVKMDGQEEELSCSFFYASNLEDERRVLWNDIRNHSVSQMFQNKQWLIIGDFNEILVGNEHSRYESNPVISQGTRDFHNLVQHYLLSDLSHHGPLFTWCNK